MPKSKRDLSREHLPQLADALAKDEEFCFIVDHFSPDRAQRLDAIIIDTAPTVDDAVPSTLKSVSQSFGARLLGEHPAKLSADALRLQRKFRQYNTNKRHRKHMHEHVANRVGFKEKDFYKRLPSHIPIIEVEPLPAPYPPEGHIVLERHYPVPPPPPKLNDPTCNYLYDYCELDETKLQYTVDMNQEAVFVDKTTKDPVVVGLRNFAKGYYDIIQPWSVDLVTASLRRRTHYVLRNDGGRMAGAGVSSGERSKSLFGWVRNLRIGQGRLWI
jgi:hypothetical protein